jgi:hypothetical protein
MAKLKPPPRTDIEIRRLVHRYFYDRYKNGRGERGKHGVSAKISVIRMELKGSHGISQNEIAGALIYLIDQGWVKKEEVHRTFASASGTNYASDAIYYRITADGIDKIDGEGEYTMPKFHGININATGQNIITLGDNNQIAARFESIANKLIEFKDAVRKAMDLEDSDKVSIIADVDTMESQLAKPQPNCTVLRTLWAGIQKLTAATSLAANVATIAPLLTPLLG